MELNFEDDTIIFIKENEDIFKKIKKKEKKKKNPLIENLF